MNTEKKLNIGVKSVEEVIDPSAEEEVFDNDPSANEEIEYDDTLDIIMPVKLNVQIAA